MLLYKITNTVNGKVYIGKTSHHDVNTRWNEHIRDSRKPRCEKRPLYDAMLKYGNDAFVIEQIEEVENDQIACQQEQYWIKYYNSYVGFENCNGYNATLGGDSKRYYDYKEISDKYIELKSEKDTAKFFNCDIETVRKACRENNVRILTPAEISKLTASKKIAQLDKDTQEIIAVYDSVSDAFRALNKQKSGGIAKACRENKVCIGYRWKYI